MGDIYSQLSRLSTARGSSVKYMLRVSKSEYLFIWIGILAPLSEVSLTHSFGISMTNNSICLRY